MASGWNFYEVTPFPEGIGSLGNGLYFVILAGVGASFLYLMLKRKNFRLITIIISMALTTAVIMLAVIYLYAAFSIFIIPYTDLIVLVLSTGITVLADLAIFRAHSRFSDLAILFLGGALGAFLGTAIHPLSAILILIFLAIYDIFAVYRGPVGKIAESGLEKLHGLSFSFKDIQIGLGDLTFYSMLTSQVLVNTNFTFFLVSAAGVLVGAFLAFKMLERRGMFPGLPFPIAFGLLPLIVWLISQ